MDGAKFDLGALRRGGDRQAGIGIFSSVQRIGSSGLNFNL
jgi:hypothetical protein